MRNKHLPTFTQNLKVIETPGVFFFSNLFCGSTHFSAPTLKISCAWEVDAPEIHDTASEVDAPEITWYE